MLLFFFFFFGLIVSLRSMHGCQRYLLHRLGGLRPELAELSWSGPLCAQLQHTRQEAWIRVGGREAEHKNLDSQKWECKARSWFSVSDNQLIFNSENRSVVWQGHSKILLVCVYGFYSTAYKPHSSKQENMPRSNKRGQSGGEFWQANWASRWELMPIIRGNIRVIPCQNWL